MKKNVQVQIEDKIYNATLQKITNGFKVGVEFSIVGETFRFWCKGLRQMSLDEEFTVHGTKLRVVYYNGEFDIVQHDRFVSYQIPYTGSAHLTWWTVLGILICLALLVLTLGGIVPIVIGLVGCVLIYDVSRTPFYPLTKQLTYSIVILVILYGITWFLLGEFALFSKLL